MATDKIMDPSRTIREIEARESVVKPYDAGDRAQVNDARKRAGRKKIKQVSFIQRVMEDPDGRRWVWEFLSRCNAYSQCSVPGDPYMTHFNDGQQNVGKLLLLDVIKFPDLYLKMMTEAANGWE